MSAPHPQRSTDSLMVLGESIVRDLLGFLDRYDQLTQSSEAASNVMSTAGGYIVAIARAYRAGESSLHLGEHHVAAYVRERDQVRITREQLARLQNAQRALEDLRRDSIRASGRTPGAHNVRASWRE